MKRRHLRGIGLAALILTLLAPSAIADAITEPRSDFYQSHYEACTYVGRTYVAAGYDGKVQLLTSPVNFTVVAEYENGTELWISFTWEDGEGYLWGAYDNYSADKGKVGWLPMDDLTLKYDSAQFAEAHQNELLQNTGLYPEGDRALVYTYPSSGEYQELTEDRDYMPFSEAFSDSSLYIDEAGRSWVSISYYMGRRDGWICVDDPLNETLNTGFVEPGQSAAQQRGASTIGGMNGTAANRWQITLIAVALVALVLLITLLAVKRFYPKKK